MTKKDAKKNAAPDAALTTLQDAKAPATGLAIAQNIVGQILLPADLSALDAMVKAFGDRSAKLTADEKATAIQIVDDWDKSVTQRISTNASMANEILAFLDGQSMGGDCVDRCIELFHDAFGDTPEYDAYKSALEACADIRREQPVADAACGDMTLDMADRIRSDNYNAELKWRRQVSAADAACAKAVKAYVKSVLAMPETKDAMSRLRSYARKATRLAADCSDKAAKAKINISISDEDTRALLHELMDFAKKF